MREGVGIGAEIRLEVPGGRLVTDSPPLGGDFHVTSDPKVETVSSAVIGAGDLLNDESR